MVKNQTEGVAEEMVAGRKGATLRRAPELTVEEPEQEAVEEIFDWDAWLEEIVQHVEEASSQRHIKVRWCGRDTNYSPRAPAEPEPAPPESKPGSAPEPQELSHGRHCHSTQSLAVIGCHSLMIYTNLAAIAVIFCENDSVALGYRRWDCRR